MVLNMLYEKAMIIKILLDLRKHCFVLNWHECKMYLMINENAIIIKILFVLRILSLCEFFSIILD